MGDSEELFDWDAYSKRRDKSYEGAELVPVPDLIDRGVYLISSRNLTTGVWRASKGSFVGVREKFRDKFLASEIHHDLSEWHGTVGRMKFLHMLPDEIYIAENLSEMFDMRPGAPGRALFDYLDRIDQAYHKEWMGED